MRETGQFDAISSGRLSLVKRGISLSQGIFKAMCPMEALRNPNGGRAMQQLSRLSHFSRLAFHTGTQALSQKQDPFKVGVKADSHKFFSADTTCQVALTHSGAK